MIGRIQAGLFFVGHIEAVGMYLDTVCFVLAYALIQSFLRGSVDYDFGAGLSQSARSEKYRSNSCSIQSRRSRSFWRVSSTAS